jgi:hypothetical protein
MTPVATSKVSAHTLDFNTTFQQKELAVLGEETDSRTGAKMMQDGPRTRRKAESKEMPMYACIHTQPE